MSNLRPRYVPGHKAAVGPSTEELVKAIEELQDTLRGGRMTHGSLSVVPRSIQIGARSSPAGFDIVEADGTLRRVVIGWAWQKETADLFAAAPALRDALRRLCDDLERLHLADDQRLGEAFDTARVALTLAEGCAK